MDAPYSTADASRAPRRAPEAKPKMVVATAKDLRRALENSAARVLVSATIMPMPTPVRARLAASSHTWCETPENRVAIEINAKPPRTAGRRPTISAIGDRTTAPPAMPKRLLASTSPMVARPTAQALPTTGATKAMAWTSKPSRAAIIATKATANI